MPDLVPTCIKRRIVNGLNIIAISLPSRRSAYTVSKPSDSLTNSRFRKHPVLISGCESRVSVSRPWPYGPDRGLPNQRWPCSRLKRNPPGARTVLYLGKTCRTLLWDLPVELAKIRLQQKRIPMSSSLASGWPRMTKSSTQEKAGDSVYVGRFADSTRLPAWTSHLQR